MLLLVILPVNGDDAVTGINFWLHLVTPLLTVILFLCVETSVLYTRRDTALIHVPYWAYLVVYWVMAILIGEEKGGWRDFYNVRMLRSLWILLPILLLLGYFVAIILRRLHNYRARKGMKRISGMWSKDLEPIELKIEVFGLGRYMGAQYQGDERSMPFDIFEIMTKRYDVTMEELTRAYIRGFLDSSEEKRKRNKKDDRIG